MSEINEEFKARVLEMAEKEMVLDVDGLYYYYPTGTGYVTSYHLRIIADELDRRNEDWNNTINQYLEENNV